MSFLSDKLTYFSFVSLGRGSSWTTTTGCSAMSVFLSLKGFTNPTSLLVQMQTSPYAQWICAWTSVPPELEILSLHIAKKYLNQTLLSHQNMTTYITHCNTAWNYFIFPLHSWLSVWPSYIVSSMCTGHVSQNHLHSKAAMTDFSCTFRVHTLSTVNSFTVICDYWKLPDQQK
jgi:hypothetical protein